MNNRYPALRSLDASDADAFESIVIGADATITFEVGSRSFPPRMTVCTGHEASFVLTPAGHLTTTVCRVVDASDAGDAGQDASPTASNPSDYPAYTLTIASSDGGTQRFCAERACTEGRAVFWYSMQQVDRAFSDDTPF